MSDEALGCLAVILHALAELIASLAQFLPGEFFGWIGKWTLRGITFGHSDRSSDDLACVLTGLAMFIGVIVLVVWLC